MKLSPRLHAGISLLIGLILISAVYAILVLPAVAQRQEIADRAEELRNQYLRFTAAARAVPQLRAEVRRLRSMDSQAVAFLEDTAPGLAAADLQRRLNGIVSQSNGTVVSTQVVPSGNAIFPGVTLRTNVRSDVEAFLQILGRLSGSEPVLILDNINIQARGTGGNRRRASQSSFLEARFDVTGYIFTTDR